MSDRSKKISKGKLICPFLCTSVRLQIAEVLSHEGSKVCPGGIGPADLHPFAIRLNQEMGIYVGGQRSGSVRNFHLMHIDHVEPSGPEIPQSPGLRTTSRRTIPAFPLRSQPGLSHDKTEVPADSRMARGTSANSGRYLRVYPAVPGELISVTRREGHRGASSDSEGGDPSRFFDAYTGRSV